jgi:membrane glycosyltransferase
MKITELIKSLALGAFVGCFIVLLVAVLFSFSYGPENVVLSGTEIINAFFGSIVIGWAFSLTGHIYDREDIALPFQVLFQMGIGFAVLLGVAIYLKWLPLDLGFSFILTWILIAVIFATVFWLGFYIYYYLLARDINQKLA